MAYDFVVGKSPYKKDCPTVVGGIEFEEYPYICALLKRTDNFFLTRISNLFNDQSFSLEELEAAQASLSDLLVEKLTDNERNLLHKLIAVICYALCKRQQLHGVAD